MTRTRRIRRRATLLGLALALATGGAASGVESVGVAPVTADATAPRDEAVKAAVAAAVARAAIEMLPADFTPPDSAIGPDGELLEPSAWVEQRLGEDPFAYATRFRILEDRGRRPAMFASDPEVEFEYVVVADVDLDLDAIRARLEAVGLSERGSGGLEQEVVLVVEGLSSYQPLALLRSTLEADRGVRSVVPIEFTAGRAVLSVDADRDAGQLAADLARHAPPGLQIMTVEEGSRSATVLVEWDPPAPAADAPGASIRPESGAD